MDKKRVYVLLFLVLGITLPGYCLAAAKKSATLAELALYQGADRQQILEEGARKEGKLSFYIPANIAANPVVKAFQKKYPFIKVDMWMVNAMEVLTRVREEFSTGHHIMDVMVGSQTNMMAVQQAGMVQPFISPNLAQIEDEAKTNAPSGGVLSGAINCFGIGFGYNTKMLSKDQLPKTYHDLADPKWKGKLVIVGSNMGINGMSAIYRNYGVDLVKKIAAQDFKVQMLSHAAALELIAAGEYAASPSIPDSTVYAAKLRGAPVAWIPLEPVRVLVNQVAISKYAPNPHAALLFADFELSKESGEIHRNLGFGSFRQDVAPVGQRYKKYYGSNTLEAIKEEYDMFRKLFFKK